MSEEYCEKCGTMKGEFYNYCSTCGHKIWNKPDVLSKSQQESIKEFYRRK